MVAANSAECPSPNLVYIDFINGRAVITDQTFIDPARLESEVFTELTKKPLLLGNPAADQCCIQPENTAARIKLQSPAVIVIGDRTDPFAAVNENLFAAITFLDHLAQANTPRIVVRSRSPYIILATPALRLLNSSAGSRTAAVCLGLEAATAAHSRLVSRQSAPAAERLETMRSLRSHGIPVIAQFAPFFGSAQSLESCEQFCRQICESAADVLLIDFERLIPDSAARTAEAAQFAARTFTSARHGRRTRSYIIAEQILTAIAVEKVITAEKQADSATAKSESIDSKESIAA